MRDVPRLGLSSHMRVFTAAYDFPAWAFRSGSSMPRTHLVLVLPVCVCHPPRTYAYGSVYGGAGEYGR